MFNIASRGLGRLTVLAAAGAAFTTPALACSSCGCSLSSDWSSQGIVPAGEGLRVDLRFDFFDQNQLRSGTRAVDRASLPIPNEEEIQQQTLNRNLALGVDYSPQLDWGINLQLPYYDRYHTTIAEGDAEVSTSHTKSIGDVRLVGRYLGLAAGRNVGVQLGVKLPTGSIDNDFIAGPQQGERLDRGLQPGTGTTDLLVGAFTFGAPSRDWDAFAQGLVQLPLNSRDGFKPGNGLNLNAGLRYMGFEGVTPSLQINARIEGRESGANADVANSGASLVYLSPGLNLQLGDRLHGYAFLQLPIYQRVNGLQIEPRYTATIGVYYTM